MAKLKDYQPAKETKSLIQVPAFIDVFGEDFSSAYEQARKGNENLKFYEGLGGSNPLMTGLVNKVFADNGGKFRTPVPTDNVYETIFPMSKGRFYTDMNALDVWGEKPVYERNIEIWRQFIGGVEEHLGRKVKFPFRGQGFYCVPDKSKGVRIEPADNFRVIEDDRLNLPIGTRFNKLDENGIIIPDNKGKFTKINSKKGVCRVGLYHDGNLDGSGGNLAVSGGIGRMVVVDAEDNQKNYQGNKGKE